MQLKKEFEARFMVKDFSVIDSDRTKRISFSLDDAFGKSDCRIEWNPMRCSFLLMLKDGTTDLEKLNRFNRANGFVVCYFKDKRICFRRKESSVSEESIADCFKRFLSWIRENNTYLFQSLMGGNIHD